MEVVHSNPDAEQLVFGGQAPESFSIADDSPEFYALVSQNIYQYPKYAYIREVLCNAHDAHIASGIPTRPVEVTVTQEEGQDPIVTIKDFGSGIPHDMINEMYCRLGGSTKKGDPNATGGMGLGSKSPHTVTNTFTVINCHGGVKTEYLMIRRDPRLNNLPSSQALYSEPTTETGLTVVVQEEEGVMRDIIRRIRWATYSGGIPCKLNGQELDVFDYSEGEKYLKFSVIKGLPNTLGIPNIGTPVGIKMGSVVYPLDVKIHFGSDSLRYLASYGDNQIILHAEPGSLALMPSREGIITEEPKNIEYIKKLIDDIEAKGADFLKHFHTRFKKGEMLDIPLPEGRAIYRELFRFCSLKRINRNNSKGWMGTRTNMWLKLLHTNGFNLMTINRSKHERFVRKVIEPMQQYLSTNFPYLAATINRKLSKLDDYDIVLGFLKGDLIESDFSHFRLKSQHLPSANYREVAIPLSSYKKFQEDKHKLPVILKDILDKTEEDNQLHTRLRDEYNKKFKPAKRVVKRYPYFVITKNFRESDKSGFSFLVDRFEISYERIATNQLNSRVNAGSQEMTLANFGKILVDHLATSTHPKTVARIVHYATAIAINQRMLHAPSDIALVHNLYQFGSGKKPSYNLEYSQSLANYAIKHYTPHIEKVISENSMNRFIQGVSNNEFFSHFFNEENHA